MSVLTFIIGCLAVWRLSHALVKENGPLMMFARLRARLAARQKRSGGFFDLFSCVYCVSVWIGLIPAAFVSHDFYHLVGYTLAFSGVAVLLESFLSKQTNPLALITSPAADNKVSISRSAPSEKGKNVISNPDSHYGSLAVKATTSLDN